MEPAEIRRHPELGVTDRHTVNQILDEGFVCHAAYLIDDRPVVIPTLYVRDDDSILLHGSPASGIVKAVMRGSPLSVAATHAQRAADDCGRVASDRRAVRQGLRRAARGRGVRSRDGCLGRCGSCEHRIRPTDPVARPGAGGNDPGLFDHLPGFLRRTATPVGKPVF